MSLGFRVAACKKSDFVALTDEFFGEVGDNAFGASVLERWNTLVEWGNLRDLQECLSEQSECQPEPRDSGRLRRTARRALPQCGHRQPMKATSAAGVGGMALKWFFLGEDPLKGSDINVDTNNHVVTLRGTVKSTAGRARAVALARRTDGVTKAVDELKIRSSASK